MANWLLLTMACILDDGFVNVKKRALEILRRLHWASSVKKKKKSLNICMRNRAHHNHIIITSLFQKGNIVTDNVHVLLILLL